MIYRSHPANANADDLATVVDLSALVNFINEERLPPYGLYSTDIDHSGVADELDIARAIDLLNGINSFAVWIATDLPDAADLRNDLVSRARRDAAVVVRIAATRALGGMHDANVQKVLEEIARDDPDQNVRYAAERLIYDRRQREHPVDDKRSSGSNGT